MTTYTLSDVSEAGIMAQNRHAVEQLGLPTMLWCHVYLSKCLSSQNATSVNAITLEILCLALHVSNIRPLRKWQVVIAFLCYYITAFIFYTKRKKRKRSESVLWQKPLRPQLTLKSKVSTRKRYHKLSFRTKLGRSVGVTTVIQLVYLIPTRNWAIESFSFFIACVISVRMFSKTWTEKEIHR